MYHVVAGRLTHIFNHAMPGATTCYNISFDFAKVNR
jgi:hypothetical protein